MTTTPQNQSGNDGIAARALAARILNGVFLDKREIDESAASAEHGPAERARARSIARGVMRRLDAIDALIDPHVERKTPFAARNLLRIAAWELHFDEVPPHAAIASAVEVAKRSKKIGRFKGVINAVGRKIAEAAIDDAPLQALPKYLRVPFVKAYGEQATAAMEAVFATGAPTDLSVRDAGQTAEMAASLNAEALPTGSLRLLGRAQISALPGYEDGAFWVQDAAAALPAKMLGDVAGAHVLDLCAAPGGKTLQLAAAGADVTALDVSDARLERVQENLERTKLSAKLVAADATDWTPDDKFDAILLDAPCSATGTLRRHPELPFIRADANLQPVFALQRELLERALGWLKPGGKLVFATCSLLPAEGEDLIGKMKLESQIDAASASDLGAPAEWISPQGWLRTRPDFWAERGGVDGFFAVRLKA